MCKIYISPELLAKLETMVAKEDRLIELLDISLLEAKNNLPKRAHLVIHTDQIYIPLSWDNSRPPYILPSGIDFTENHLLGLLFHFFENDQKAWEYLNGSELYKHIEHENRLKYGMPFQAENLKEDTYVELHNKALIHHYGVFEPENGHVNPETLYLLAIEKAPDAAHRAFSIKELATLYLDNYHLEEAGQCLETGIAETNSDPARYALLFLQIKVWMEQLSVPYDEELLAKLRSKIWETLTYFEENGNQAQAGLLLLDATHIANISGSYSEALGYVKRAIDIFDELGLEELSGSAKMKKGTLLYTWAQQGNPQFYKAAVESYQQALYIFTKENHPATFAEIHHNLGVLYAEMPADKKKRGIWAGVASASFNEALEFYTREQYPYQYGSICNNYGNALTKFPPALHSDNNEKAIQYYLKALTVRTSDYPFERAITLLNYLEASWNAANDPDVFNYTRYDDMLQKAKEVNELVSDPDLLAQADRHIENLTKLRELE